MGNGVSPKFKEWACSLSGCDGGNPDAEIWICGIEWGLGKKDNAAEYYNTTLPNEIAQGKVTPFGPYDWKGTLKTPYGKNVAKLVCSIKDGRAADYPDYIEKNQPEIFKLNLYPIAFNNTSSQLWNNHLKKLTGFDEKYLFKIWCARNRFPHFSELVSRKNPKWIIGTGISYLMDFFVCFAGNNLLNTGIGDGKITKASDNSTRSYCWAKLTDNTTLVVIPFFSGSHGLHSDELIEKMGKIISNL